jgi:hypothetical protein
VCVCECMCGVHHDVFGIHSLFNHKINVTTVIIIRERNIPTRRVSSPHRDATFYGLYRNVEFYNVSIVIGSMLSTKK